MNLDPNGWNTTTPSQTPTPSPQAIRAWAREKGLPVGNRGRIAADVQLAYQEANQS